MSARFYKFSKPCVIIAALLCFGFVVSLDPPVPKESETYQLGIFVIGLGAESRADSHVINLPKDESRQVRYWLNCPVQSTPEVAGHACGYYGPTLPVDEKGNLPDRKKYEYHAQIQHQVLTKGFPLKVDLRYTREIQAKKVIEIEIAGIATFDKLDHIAVMRSNCGEYILVAKLYKSTKASRNF